MNQSEAVSVVIPAHRQDAWLDEAVTTVLSSENVPVRVIVVLNGIATIEERGWSTDPRVSLVHEPHALGPTLAMIRGLEHTHTEFIARLDADDRMLPGRLAAQAEYLRRHTSTQLVGTAARRIDERGESAGSIRMPTGADVRKHLVLSNVVPHSSVMFRRSDLDAVGGYDPALSQMEDYDVILRLAARGPIAILPEEYTEYRLHTGQVSRGAKPSGLHIKKVLEGRKRLGQAIHMGQVGVAARNAIWRVVQYTRYYRVTKPAHEY